MRITDTHKHDIVEFDGELIHTTERLERYKSTRLKFEVYRTNKGSLVVVREDQSAPDKVAVAVLDREEIERRRRKPWYARLFSGTPSEYIEEKLWSGGITFLYILPPETLDAILVEFELPPRVREVA